jgi:hypothetical protein
MIPDLVTWFTILISLIVILMDSNTSFDKNELHWTKLEYKIILLPIFIKYSSYTYLIDSIEERLNLTDNGVHFWRVLKLFSKIYSMCHVVGTLFHALSMFEYYYLDIPNSWLVFNDLIDRDWLPRYLECVYWAQATIMLIGTKG